jgi:hypothetical protein
MYNNIYLFLNKNSYNDFYQTLYVATCWTLLYSIMCVLVTYSLYDNCCDKDKSAVSVLTLLSTTAYFPFCCSLCFVYSVHTESRQQSKQSLAFTVGRRARRRGERELRGVCVCLITYIAAIGVTCVWFFFHI